MCCPIIQRKRKGVTQLAQGIADYIMRSVFIVIFATCALAPSYAVPLQKLPEPPIWDDESGPIVEQAQLVPRGANGHSFELVISNSAKSAFTLKKLEIDDRRVRFQIRHDGEWTPTLTLKVPPQGRLRAGITTSIRAFISDLPTAHSNPTADFHFNEDFRLRQSVSPCMFLKH